MMSELHEYDALGQAELLGTGEVSSVDMVAHHLDRIENDTLGAFMTVTAERALDQARAIDERRARSEELPAFAGVPTAFKDTTPTAGVRTTFGSRLMADFVPDVSAHIVDLIEGAGFISLGKTNAPEFGLSSYTDNDLIGPARTPFDPTRNAGGSSGGAAAAVASGLLPVAPGSDGGGSIRIPAACCGLVGFKPSRGRVSAGPSHADWNGLVVDGPLARTVHDAAALLDVMAQPVLGNPRPFPPPAIPFAEHARRDPGRLRIARWSGSPLPGVETDPACVTAWETASQVLADLGHEVVDVDPPFPADLEPRFNVLWSTGVAAIPVPEEFESSLRPNTRYWRAQGRESTGIDLASAMQSVDTRCRSALRELGAFDAFLTPTLALPPQPVEWFNASGDPATDHARELTFTPFTALYNMTGSPAVTLPAGVAEGLPVGIMLAGHPGADGLLFSLAGQFESAA